MENISIYREIKNETLLEVSRLAAQKTDWKSILDQLIQFVRPYFIFDNIAIYLPEIETKHLEVLYARATGRGKTAGAEVTWGETIANRVADGKEIIIESPESPIGPDRLEYPFILGLPLVLTDSFIGALIFVRFGGPEFLKEGIDFAEFLGTQISIVLKGKCLNNFEQELEFQRRSTKLQGDFINTITHELRSPLGFIRGYTTTLLRNDTNWDEKTRHDFLEIIERESNNLTDLIDNLLDSSRLQSGQMQFDFQFVRLDSLIRDEVNRAALNHPEQSVILDFADKLPVIRGDARRLAQVFDNLLNNSYKYAPCSTINISVYPSNTDVVIEFSDTGPGITERYLPHVFSRFFRDPEQSMKAHGTGLGLSICKQIIESHNGKIEVSSPVGSGAIFRITLPIGTD